MPSPLCVAARRLCCAFLLTGAPAALVALDVPLTVEERHGFTRRAENVTAGVPLLRGALRDLARLSVLDPRGNPVPAQFETLATWPDGSAKWVLVDFSADCPARGKTEYRLNDSGKRPDRTPSLSVEQSGDSVSVQSGPLRCEFGRSQFNLFRSVQLDHNRDGAFSDAERITKAGADPGIRVVGVDGTEFTSQSGKIKAFEVEAKGPVRATLMWKGSLADRAGNDFLSYTLRLHFYAGSGLVRAFFTLENLNPANPATGNYWGLGQSGNLMFKEAALWTRLGFSGPIQLSIGDGAEDILDRVIPTAKGGIYQDSSGGEHWFHRNHMNREYKIPLRFQGAHAFLDGVEPYSRKRPDAWMQAADRQFGLAVAVRHFWQNFPKALSTDAGGNMRVALWPEESAAPHELQGGEIKTHEVAFFFHTGNQRSTPAENRVATAMGAFHHPVHVTAPAEYYMATGIFDDAVPYDPQRFQAFERYQQGGITNTKRNLVLDNEEIDEYGWRNFGDMWARNERDTTNGPNHGREMVNHYNLEYDLGYGMLFASLRTAGTPLSGTWWDLAEAALRHESDIDTYHAMSDTKSRGAYSGGKYTHTQHGVEAVLSTHRGAPPHTWFGSLKWPWGEGSAPESGHFNTRGQIAYYYMTGDRRVLESALEQTALVYRKVSENIFPQINQLNRDAGNNLQILTDGYLLTWDEKYRTAAEKILRTTAPETQWYMTAEGREKNAKKQVDGWWTASICIDAAARWTAVMEEKLGKPYEMGRNYVVAYADFTSRFLSGGPDKGFYMSWTPAGGGRGDHGPWTYRLTDTAMYGHKYSSDPEVKARCLKAAADAFTFLERRAPGEEPIYWDSKPTTMILGGGHEYTYFMKNQRWPE